MFLFTSRLLQDNDIQDALLPYESDAQAIFNRMKFIGMEAGKSFYTLWVLVRKLSYVRLYTQSGLAQPLTLGTELKFVSMVTRDACRETLYRERHYCVDCTQITHRDALAAVISAAVQLVKDR